VGGLPALPFSHFLQIDHPAHRHTSPEDTPPSISPHIDKIQATCHTGCPQYMDLVRLNIHREFAAAKMASFVGATRHGSCLCKARQGSEKFNFNKFDFRMGTAFPQDDSNIDPPPQWVRGSFPLNYKQVGGKADQWLRTGECVILE
jgi:hypothetical protein